jgi:hypothetical protein
MIMSLERLKERREQLNFDIQSQQRKITDLKAQVEGAEATIRQWTDTILIQRGQLLEIDNLINEAEQTQSEEIVKEVSKKGRKKDEESSD